MHPQPSSTASLLSVVVSHASLPTFLLLGKRKRFHSIGRGTIRRGQVFSIVDPSVPNVLSIPSLSTTGPQVQEVVGANVVSVHRTQLPSVFDCKHSGSYSCVHLSFSFLLPSPTDSLPKGFNKLSCLVTIAMMKTPQPKSSWRGKDLFGSCFHILVHH